MTHALLLAWMVTSTAHAEQLLDVQRVEIIGARRTREQTLLALLPRKPPAIYHAREIRDFERRLANLELFDSIDVRTETGTLQVKVREKWTLIPVFDFGTGKTAKDTYVELGAIEYNFLGTGASLGVWGAYVDRGPNFVVEYGQHAYHPARWSMATFAEFQTSGFRFDDQQGWLRRRIGAGFSWTSPFLYGFPLSYEVGLSYHVEDSRQVRSTYAPPSGHDFSLRMILTWNRYRWHDYAPSGYTLTLTLKPGWLFGPPVPESRSKVEATFLGALRITSTTVLMAHARLGTLSRGNVNFSKLIGSVSGVRGLDDAFYRSWAYTVGNVELRQALPIGKRWALQGVLFGDSALFSTMTSRGVRQDTVEALSAGWGVRLIPTFLSEGVLRFDAGRLLLPSRSWFYQFGIAQYF